ncbi:ABC transporter substrate-binding protein [Subtercola boreus]|uniref:Thiamine pyrimidine synthase n=1 Tax=Subtercola boreus TaxID=120213 RepID=A0A3E0WF60_9MICO|nr:ABC transporter substrate-binding protein [Subtercola boreus]RFA22408.1 ABC transporter substrate-binding protein [Subtercola boreus]RFA22470.1 ABC transporter substrate-binding protein [Subtercola boreus]RFA28485.1 ABC transporter substrate-binding protein [Subtercola boreus]
MKHSRRITLGVAAIAASAALVLTGCSSSSGSDTTATSSDGSALTPVKLQLQWFTQAQFAGYYAALDQGYFKDEGLDVTIIEGGTDIVPQTQLADGAVDYAVAWVPKALASREQGAGITDVAQILQKSGTLQVSMADKNITTAADLKGKTVGNWGYGNEFEMFAGITKAGLDPANDVKLVQQAFDESGLLDGSIDAAQAETYNEYAQILETMNPATGKLYQPGDLNVIDWNTEGTAMLQDAIWANTEKLNSDQAYQDQTVKFLTAALKGWIYARDNPQKAADIVVAKGSQLGASHQLWQTNEINKLIWPSADGIGVIDDSSWKQTVSVAMTAKNLEGTTVITKEPDSDAYTNTYVQKALDALKGEGVDVTGTSYKPIDVTLTEGGK